MSVNDVFWLFFMFAAFQPLIQQKMLEAMRTRKIAQLEGQRNSRVILLVHRQETMRFLGFPLVRYIDINDSEEVLRAIHLTDDDMPLDGMVRPCSCPASKRSWEGAPKPRSTPCPSKSARRSP
jgi:ClpP class serine protease